LTTHLRIGIRASEQSTVLRVEGELDLASSRHLEEAIRYARRRRPALLVFDLEKLRFLDMAGLRTLLAARGEADRSGQRLVLSNVPGRIRRVLALAGAEDLLPVMEGDLPW
jgi:anti-anti-sigma factor